jgi:hypothetical protein
MEGINDEDREDSHENNITKKKGRTGRLANLASPTVAEV